jgi:hypothetical protein
MNKVKFSDLDIDIPTSFSEKIRKGFPRAVVYNSDRKEYQPHPAGIYFYKSVPHYDNLCVIDYKEMEIIGYQKIDILNNNYLDELTDEEFFEFLEKIDNEYIDWEKLQNYNEPYQLSKYPGILKEFNVRSVLDVAIVLSIIRPGAVKNYNEMKKYMKMKKIKKNNNPEILNETYGIPVFDEQYKILGIKDGKYRYKKSHAIGYSYILLMDFLKKIKKN